jgi:hypothetical protein
MKFSALYATIVFAIAVALSGCAGQTVEQKAFETYGTFVVAEEAAAALIQDPDVPEQAKVAIQLADSLAKPAADTLLEAALKAIEIKAAVDAGERPSEDLDAILGLLEELIAEVRPDVMKLLDAVGEATR